MIPGFLLLQRHLALSGLGSDSKRSRIHALSRPKSLHWEAGAFLLCIHWILESPRSRYSVNMERSAFGPLIGIPLHPLIHIVIST